MYSENNNGGISAQGASSPTKPSTTFTQTKPATTASSATHAAAAVTPSSASDKKKPERISFPKKVKIMYDAMCRMGIAQANAIYSVGEYFKSLDTALAKAKSGDKISTPENVKMQFSDKQARIINVFLNEGYDAGKGANSEAISEHRQSKVAILVGAMCDILRKEHNIRLASMLAVIAVNPKYIAEFAGTLGKTV